MLLKVCVNGARQPQEHPALSARADDVAAQAASAVAAGAGAVHVHPKDAQGRDSLAGADTDRFVTAVRAACPRIPIGVTTGAWSSPTVQARLESIAAWSVLPDFASVNWHEDGADDVAAALLARGIGVEAGIWHERGLAAWRASPYRGRCVRALVEIQDITDTHEIRREASALVDGIRAATPGLDVLLHGEEASTWPALRLAVEWGLDTRIGLEDTLHLPNGRPVTDNAELVAAVHALEPEHT